MIGRLRPKGEFAGNILVLMTGSTLAQAIPIAVSPILTRLYTPEEFGIFALYISLASFIALGATGRYELAVMLPKKDSDALHIAFLSVGITAAVSLLSLLLVAVFNRPIVRLLGNPELSGWLYLLPLSVFLTGIYQTANYLNNRQKRYKVLAKNRVLRSAATATSNIGFGMAGIGGGLILGNIVGQAAATWFLGSNVRKTFRNRIGGIDRLKAVALAKRYRKFPWLNLPNAMIDGFRQVGINTLVAQYYLTAMLGQFSFALKMVQIPSSLIGGSLSQVFYEKVSKTSRGELYVLVKRFFWRSAAVSLPMYILIALFAEDVFGFVFGPIWSVAGTMASVMTPWLFLNFLTSPLSMVFVAISRQEVLLVFSVLNMVVPIGLLAGFHTLDFPDLLKLLVAAMVLLRVVFIAVLFSMLYRQRAAVRTLQE